MIWRPGQDPARLTNFETVARTLRYRQFAYGCLEQDIKSLFLGHHASDLAETIIHRLVRGQRFASAGLSGIKPVNGIPCCERIFGASCGFEASSVFNLIGNRSITPSTAQESESSTASSPGAGNDSFPAGVLVSHPGIKIYRPLLSFPKSRLIATCTANGVPFVTDPSNFDPKTTTRNAIRWLLSNDKLPMALRQDSVLRLGAASTRLSEVRMKKVEELMNATQLVHFDTRSGRLRLIVPKDIGKAHEASELDAAYYVSRLLSLVSPVRETPRSFLDHIATARWMFPELHVAGFSESDEPIGFRSCTAGDALVERLPGLSGRFWQLTRRPLRADEHPESTFSQAPFYSTGTDRDWSTWRAWDGRYWIRIRPRDPMDLRHIKIRALRPSDMVQLRAGEERLPPKLQQVLRNALRDAAPGKVRYTLPVLLKGEDLRALPTFNIEFASKDTLQDEADQIQCEVRYKDITEALQHLKNPDSYIKGVAKLDFPGGSKNQLSSNPYLEKS